MTWRRHPKEQAPVSQPALCVRCRHQGELRIQSLSEAAAGDGATTGDTGVWLCAVCAAALRPENPSES